MSERGRHAQVQMHPAELTFPPWVVRAIRRYPDAAQAMMLNRTKRTDQDAGIGAAEIGLHGILQLASAVLALARRRTQDHVL